MLEIHRAAWAAPLILASLACGPVLALDHDPGGSTGAESDGQGDESPPEADASSGGESESTGDAEVPTGPPSFCEDVPDCEGVACAADDLAAELLAELIEAAGEAGFGEVFVPFEAHVEGGAFHYTYTLVRPGLVAMASWTSAPPESFDAAEHVQGWNPVWKDPDISVAPEDALIDALEECYPGLSENIGCFNTTADFRLTAFRGFEDDAGCEIQVSAQVDPITAFLAECTIEAPDCG